MQIVITGVVMLELCSPGDLVWMKDMVSKINPIKKGLRHSVCLFVFVNTNVKIIVPVDERSGQWPFVPTFMPIHQ